jgi:hypothetical protein
MMRRNFFYLLAVLLVLAPFGQSFARGQGQDNQTTTAEHNKNKVTRLGVGEKAKATIKLKDGTKVKGYVYRVGEDDFEIRDRKTNSSTTIRYGDVKGVDDNRGHSIARTVLIAVGIGSAVALTAVYLAIAANER